MEVALIDKFCDIILGIIRRKVFVSIGMTLICLSDTHRLSHANSFIPMTKILTKMLIKILTKILSKILNNILTKILTVFPSICRKP